MRRSTPVVDAAVHDDPCSSVCLEGPLRVLGRAPPHRATFRGELIVWGERYATKSTVRGAAEGSTWCLECPDDFDRSKLGGAELWLDELVVDGVACYPCDGEGAPLEEIRAENPFGDLPITCAPLRPFSITVEGIVVGANTTLRFVPATKEMRHKAIGWSVRCPGPTNLLTSIVRRGSDRMELSGSEVSLREGPEYDGWIGADGASWGHVTIDRIRGGDVRVVLEPAGRLEIRFEQTLYGPIVEVTVPGLERPLFAEGRGAQNVWIVDGVPPGICQVSMYEPTPGCIVPPTWERSECLWQAGVEITAGLTSICTIP